jgi:aspartyl-tRNA(Asn)/glutamyl-tRNA(Gln) amidotransferase subunit B
MLEGDTRAPKEIAESAGLIQVNDPEELRGTVRGVLQAQPAAVQEYKEGKESALQFLVGQTMKATRGAGNPGMLKTLLLEELG